MNKNISESRDTLDVRQVRNNKKMTSFEKFCYVSETLTPLLFAEQFRLRVKEIMLENVHIVLNRSDKVKKLSKKKQKELEDDFIYPDEFLYEVTNLVGVENEVNVEILYVYFRNKLLDLIDKRSKDPEHFRLDISVLNNALGIED